MIYHISAESIINGENYQDEIVTTNLKGAYDFIINHNNQGVNMTVKLWSADGELKGNYNNVVNMITRYNQAMSCGVDLVILVYALGCSLGSATQFLKEMKGE